MWLITVCYAGYEPDDTLPKLFGRYTEHTKDTYPGYMQEFFEKAISEKLIFPILGISAQSSYDFTLTATELNEKNLFHTSSKMIQMYHFFI